MKKQLITICVLLFTSQLSAAVPGKRTIIAGKFTDGRTDTLVFSFFRQHFSMTEIGAEIQTTYTSNGEFKIILPEFVGIAYCKLLGYQWPRLYIDKYLIEPGDSIYIIANPVGIRKTENLNRFGLTFSGNHPEKFRANYSINAFLRSYDDAIYLAGPPTNIVLPSIDSMMQKHTSRNLKGACLSLLANWKEKLSETAYELMKTDLLYKDHAGKLALASMALNDSRHRADSAKRKRTIVDYIKTHLLDDPYRKLTTDAARNRSIAYQEFTTRLLLQHCLILQEKNGLTDLMDFIPFIKQLPASEKEKTAADLAAYFLVYSPNIKGMDQFMEFAQSQKDPWLARQMNLLIEKMKKGAPVYAFSLPDKNGKQVSINQFKGKAVLIDFWFTGCIPCQALEKKMWPVKEKLKENTKVIFMSINIDKEKSKWIEGLNTGLYTDKESVNLFTDGMGGYHPLLPFYNIKAVPKLLLVDAKGKIFSSTPPTPDTRETTDMLINQLQEASRD